MRRLQILITAISITFISFSMNDDSNIKINNTPINSDSLIIEKYKSEIKKEYVENTESLTNNQVDSVFGLDRRVFGKSSIVYSQDKSFKIFTIEVESCGAYCNSSWFSWIHYNLKGAEKTKKMDFGPIDSIYKLPDNKYLVVSMNWGRPSSNYFVRCINANLLAFENDSIKTLAITYKKENAFGFCQESSVQSEIEPFIRYDTSNKRLMYQYANNNIDDNKPDIDVVRKGYFIYKSGKFIFVKEATSVINRSNK